MRKLAEFIVDKRKFLLIIFIAAAIGSVIMSSHINVIQELTDYLPDDTETSIGLDVMDEQFTTFGTAKVMVQNVTYDQAKAIADQLKDIKGVSAVDFYEEDEDDENNDSEEKEFTNSEDMRDSYQDLAALYSISFETPEDDRESLRPLLELLQKNLGLSEDEAYLFHMETWICAHGMATMLATSFVDWDEAFISKVLTDTYEGIKRSYTGGKR